MSSDDHNGHDHDHTVFQDEDDLRDPALIKYRAIRSLLMEKGVFVADELRVAVERMEQAGPHVGAAIVAKAWTDPEFRERVLTDAKPAVAELGYTIAEADLIVVENTSELHNLIVCTLCSCYPRSILGQPPAWYISRSYRTRAVREPRAVLAEFGVQVPPNCAVRVHDSTADMRYLVLPVRPVGTEGWDNDRLAGLVTRDCLIGTALPRAVA
ncbi:MAG: nitrile hydratase subunit alpha [Pseudomonadota bacterium]